MQSPGLIKILACALKLFYLQMDICPGPPPMGSQATAYLEVWGMDLGSNDKLFLFDQLVELGVPQFPSL